ncbi:MAG TPA: hypothetical protein PK033_02210 [Acetivibrio sp.]|jgi:hypothetical protein|nr:hypothetical protein [Clostridium sp.]HOQ36486.1 hypothetical protein [Acetivibrio sp.]HPT90793.1 hypothetical protein [Acetivibrio sp.]HQA56677.1 hypothetical protein [Acetivibrio sp.]
MGKVFVDAIVQFTKEGEKIPLEIVWKDGKRFEVDRVLDIRKAASLKAGGRGIRYKCRVRGKEIYLFLDDDKWFIET